MNIIFFHGNGIVPIFGGISRITDTLGTLFASKGNNVWYIGVQDKHKGQIYREWQSFLPTVDLFSEDNISYVVNFVKKHNIDAIINQCALDPRCAKFLSMCKKREDFLLVSCFHNSILTPVINGAYQKEYLFKKKGLGWLFSLMKTKAVSSLMTAAYISKHRKRYLSTVKNSDLIFVLCNGQLPELYQMCGIEYSDKVHVVPNCINIDVEQPSNKEKTVLWVGSFDYAVKRPDNMIRIWKLVENHHPDWQLKMLGDGPSWNEMRNLSQKLGLKHASFEGRVVPDDYYRNGAILCVTSVHEAFPLVSLEAQRVGCVPVVNNSFTSAPMIVQNDQNGYLVPAFDNNSFSKTLSSLMSDNEKRLKVSKQAVKSAKRFSLDVVYAQWMKLLNEK